MLFSLHLSALTSSSLFIRILIFVTARTNGYNEIRITKKYQELDQLFGPLSRLVHHRFFGFFCLFSSVLIIFLVFCVVLLRVFTFWVPCCGVRYDVHTKTTFGSSLPEVVCLLFVSVCVQWCATYIVLCAFFLFFNFWLPLRHSLTFIYS